MADEEPKTIAEPSTDIWQRPLALALRLCEEDHESIVGAPKLPFASADESHHWFCDEPTWLAWTLVMSE